MEIAKLSPLVLESFQYCYQCEKCSLLLQNYWKTFFVVIFYVQNSLRIFTTYKHTLISYQTSSNLLNYWQQYVVMNNLLPEYLLEKLYTETISTNPVHIQWVDEMIKKKILSLKWRFLPKFTSRSEKVFFFIKPHLCK